MQVSASNGDSRLHIVAVTLGGDVLEPTAYCKASNADTFEQFGTSVALSDDTLVVGAPSEASSATGEDGNQADNSAPESGAVYVFRRSGTTWAQGAYLKASNTDRRDSFGRSVALSGDILAIATNLSPHYRASISTFSACAH